MITVNDVKRVSLAFIKAYKNVYNNESLRDSFLKKYTGDDSTFEKKYCISVDLVAKAVAKHLGVDCKKVEKLLINSTTNNLPKVKYDVDVKGSYRGKEYNHYYYLGDVK